MLTDPSPSDYFGTAYGMVAAVILALFFAGLYIGPRLWAQVRLGTIAHWQAVGILALLAAAGMALAVDALVVMAGLLAFVATMSGLIAAEHATRREADRERGKLDVNELMKLTRTKIWRDRD